MGDISVVLRGRETTEAKRSLYSTIHGAGRVMSRRQAKATVNFSQVRESMRTRGVILRGAGADESPQVYRPLASVLDAHAATIEVLHTLTPRIVVMAGERDYDPYND
jgi:tRNA-splicing ligase RtcB